LGVNNSGRAVGVYFTRDPIDGGYSEFTTFLWDNGTFTPLVYPGPGTWTYPLKLLNDDRVFGMFDLLPAGFDGGPSEPANIPGYFLFDDGHFFRLVLPSVVNGEQTFLDVNGVNEKGQLTGDYSTFECVSQFDCVVTRPGFVATPKKKAAHDGGKK
jgi:hypothetical protein